MISFFLINLADIVFFILGAFTYDVPKTSDFIFQTFSKMAMLDDFATIDTFLGK